MARQAAVQQPKPRPFGAVVRDLLIEQDIVNGLGSPNWRGFASALEGVQYESLRKALTQERPPSPKIMEAVAAGLNVDPTLFFEYQLWLAQRAFDPREVGEEEALRNLEVWRKSR